MMDGRESRLQCACRVATYLALCSTWIPLHIVRLKCTVITRAVLHSELLAVRRDCGGEENRRCIEMCNKKQ